MTAYRVLKETQYGILAIAANFQHSHAQAVILVSWDPEGFSPRGQNRTQLPTRKEGSRPTLCQFENRDR